jgi:hypothetical protein
VPCKAISDIGNDLVRYLSVAAGNRPLHKFDQVKPAFHCLDFRHKGLWLMQPVRQVSLGKACINAHLPEPLA